MTTLQDTVTEFQADLDLVHDLVHKPKTGVVQTEGGPVPPVPRMIDYEVNRQMPTLDSEVTRTQTALETAQQKNSEAAAAASIASTKSGEANTLYTTASTKKTELNTSINNTTTKLSTVQTSATNTTSYKNAASTAADNAAATLSTAQTDTNTSTTNAGSASGSATTATTKAAEAAASAITAMNNAGSSLAYFDSRVVETTTTTGAGELTLAGALTGCKTFASSVANFEWFYYRISLVNASNVPQGSWEEGWGFINGTSLVRVISVYSTNNNNFVNFAAGTKIVGLVKKQADEEVVERSMQLVEINTAVTTGTKEIVYSSGNFEVVGAVANVYTASTSGAVTVDILVNGNSMLTTPLTIDANKTSSYNSSTAMVLADADLIDGDKVSFNVTSAGTGAVGLTVTLRLRPSPIKYTYGLAKRWNAFDLANFVTRSTVGWYFDSTGTLQQAAINAGRVDYDPVTLALNGALFEESRTNLIRNNTMVGAVVGDQVNIITNGTFDTGVSGWASGNSGSGTSSWNAAYQAAELTSTVLTEIGAYDQVLTTVVGRIYTISVRARSESTTGGAVSVGTSLGGAQLLSQGVSVNSTLVATFTATTTTTYIRIRNSTATTGTVYIGDVQCYWTGALPTNWTSSSGGLIRTVVGTGTVKGIEYVDIKLSGTATAGSSVILFESTTGISTVQSDVHAFSAFLSVVSGSLANISAVTFSADERTSSSYLSSQFGSSLSVGTASLEKQRFKSNFTMQNASTANVVPYLRLVHTAGSAINVTIRIGLPQAEKISSASQTASSPIKTSGASVLRSNEYVILNGVNFDPWFNHTEGCLVGYGVSMVGGATLRSCFALSNVSDAANQRMDMQYNLTETRVAWGGTAGGTVQFSVTEANGSTSVGSVNNLAGAYKQDSFVAAKNGTLLGTDTSGLVPTGMNRLIVGAGYNAADNRTQNGYIKELRYYRVRGTNYKAQRLTA